MVFGISIGIAIAIEIGCFEKIARQNEKPIPIPIPTRIVLKLFK